LLPALDEKTLVTYRVHHLNAARNPDWSDVSNPRYADSSAFRSCPAATGEASTAGGCTAYPDTAHRCRHDRVPTHYRHECLCPYEWISLAADSLDDPAILAIMHPARHSA
jgi:hypothetical protein